MKGFKLAALILAVGILLAPASAMASSKFSFSLNLFDCLPYFVAPCPRPCIVEHVVVPQPRPIIRPVVREYYYYYNYPRVADEVRILPYPYPVPLIP